MAKYLFILLLLIITNKGFAQSTDSAARNTLVVYGDGFMFKVREPDGWTGDVANARKYFSNIVFYKSQEGIKNWAAIVQVYNFSKQDEHTEKDLAYDIKNYEDQFPALKQQPLQVSHKEYKCWGKTVYVENDFYHYIVYINPGEKYKSGISVAMNTSKRPAISEELKAFMEIIASLGMIKG